MSNDNGNRTGGPAPTWVTHAYPPGEHPAKPAPVPAPFMAETITVRSATETAEHLAGLAHLYAQDRLDESIARITISGLLREVGLLPDVERCSRQGCGKPAVPPREGYDGPLYCGPVHAYADRAAGGAR